MITGIITPTLGSIEINNIDIIKDPIKSKEHCVCSGYPRYVFKINRNIILEFYGTTKSLL